MSTSAPPPLHLITHVKISSFSARLEVNGNIGVVSGSDAHTEMFTVEFDGFKGTVNNLRAENLEDSFAAT